MKMPHLFRNLPAPRHRDAATVLLVYLIILSLGLVSVSGQDVLVRWAPPLILLGLAIACVLAGRRRTGVLLAALPLGFVLLVLGPAILLQILVGSMRAAFMNMTIGEALIAPAACAAYACITLWRAGPAAAPLPRLPLPRVAWAGFALLLVTELGLRLWSAAYYASSPLGEEFRRTLVAGVFLYGEAGYLALALAVMLLRRRPWAREVLACLAVCSVPLLVCRIGAALLGIYPLDPLDPGLYRPFVVAMFFLPPVSAWLSAGQEEDGSCA